MARITTWTEQSVLSGDEVLAVDDGTSGKKVKVSTIWDNIPNVDTTVDGIEVTGKITAGSQMLGNSAGDQAIQAEFKNYNANDSYIRIIDERQEDGTDWTTASKRIQFGVDVSDHAFISADHDASGLRGLTLGTHNSAQVEEKFIVCDADGDVALYHDNAKKLETTSYGVDVTGALKADNYIALDGYSTPDGDSNPDFYITNYETAADGQNLGIISFRGQNSNAETSNYASLIGYAPATTNGLESGAVHFSIRQPGDSYIQPLVVDVDGISVTGTVAASDGLTADYIDLTGGKTTTSTGSICADQIRFSAQTTDEAKIYASVDGLNTSLYIQSNDDEADKVRVVAGGTESLTVSKTGIDVTGDIDVTGTVKGDSLTIDNGSGLTDAYIASATGKAILAVKSTYDGTVADQEASIEIGAKNLAHIDLKTPDSDDFDLRLSHSEVSNLSMVNSLVDDLFLRSGAKVALQHGGANTKLETTSTGIDVTGTVTASEGVLIPEGKKLRLGSETDSAGLDIYESIDGDSIINQFGVGNLIVKGQNIHLNNNSDQTLITTVANSAQLFNRNGDNEGLKLETTNSGIDVTGTVEADDVVLKSPDGSRFRLTVGNDGTLSTTEI